MGTIVSRKRKDGSTGHTAQIVRKKGGKIIHRENQTFDRKPTAVAWLKRRETELSQPGAVERANAPDKSLGGVIDRYVAESKKAIGKTKAQVLEAIKRHDIANMNCGEIRNVDIVEFANELLAGGRQPATVGNYISHLAAIFAIARPAWGYPLNENEMKDAQKVLRRMGIISKSKSRDRRPTLPELDLLMQHFADRSKRDSSAALMHRIIPFAIFSTRRQDEIARQEMSDVDVDPKHSRLLVREMKHPGNKIGNDTWCDLPNEALRIIKAMNNTGRVFPYTSGAISAAFTRACQLLGIDDLRFHDLRHDGISRLFEMGNSIPEVAKVSGHKAWQSLQRYTHLKQKGDKYAGWKWLDVVTAALVVIIFLAGASQSHADFKTGNDLQEFCQVITRERIKGADDNFKLGMCVGFAEGVAKTGLLLDERLKFCIPEGVTPRQGVKVLLKYLKDNPAKLNNPAEDMVLHAFRLAWPCKE